MRAVGRVTEPRPSAADRSLPDLTRVRTALREHDDRDGEDRADEHPDGGRSNDGSPPSPGRRSHGRPRRHDDRPAAVGGLPAQNRLDRASTDPTGASPDNSA